MSEILRVQRALGWGRDRVGDNSQMATWLRGPEKGQAMGLTDVPQGKSPVWEDCPGKDRERAPAKRDTGHLVPLKETDP